MHDPNLTLGVASEQVRLGELGSWAGMTHRYANSPPSSLATHKYTVLRAIDLHQLQFLADVVIDSHIDRLVQKHKHWSRRYMAMLTR
jgi:hypothetical protein